MRLLDFSELLLISLVACGILSRKGTVLLKPNLFITRKHAHVNYLSVQAFFTRKKTNVKRKKNTNKRKQKNKRREKKKEES